MEVRIEALEGNACVVYVSGSLNTNNKSAFELAIKPIFDGNINEILIDCSDMEYISSSGLRQFLLIRKHVGALGGKVVVRGLQEDIKQIFEITGFNELFIVE